MISIVSLKDVQEVTFAAGKAFISTFYYEEEETEEESFDESDSSDFDLDLNDYGCRDITPEIEDMVDRTWDLCHPVDEVYGLAASSVIQDVVKSAKEETQCASLNFFKEITPGNDRHLIQQCTTVAYWCCCETIKRVSPIISEASLNLFY